MAKPRRDGSWRRLRIQRKIRATENVHRMAIRTLVYKLMAMGPLVLIGAIAAESHLYEDTFAGISSTSNEQSAISGYIEPVRAMEILHNTPRGISDQRKVRDVADMWITQADSHLLKPLLPSFHDDSLKNSPIKSEIKNANDELTTSLINLAAKESDLGRKTEATDDYLRALKVSGILKFSDSYSVSTYGLRERGILGRLAALAPSLDEANKAKVRESLVAMKDRQLPLDGLAHVLRNNYMVWCQSKGIDSLPIESFQKSYRPSERTGEPHVFELRNAVLASSEDKLPPFYPELELDAQSQQRVLSAIKATEAALK